MKTKINLQNYFLVCWGEGDDSGQEECHDKKKAINLARELGGCVIGYTEDFGKEVIVFNATIKA